MFRISFIPIFIFHQKNPWWRWGPDLGPLLDAPISRTLVLLTVFFSTYIMFRACILSFKTALKPFWFSICQETYVKNTQKKIRKTWKKNNFS